MMPTFAHHTVNVRLMFIASKHEDITPPPYTAPPNPTHPFVEIPHTNLWGTGQSMAKKTMTDGFFPAQLGHDSGIGILHAGVPPGPLTPVAIASSFCKSTFGAGTVLTEKKPTAGHLPPVVPLLQCDAPVPLPVGGLLLVPNTVFVGMSFMDMIMGIARVALSMALAYVFNKLGDGNGKLAKKWQSVGKLGNRFNGSTFLGAMGNKLLSGAVQDVVKTPLTVVLEGKVSLPHQIAELDLTNGQVKLFTYEVRGESWNVDNYSVNGLIDSAHTEDIPESPAEQATEGVPTINE